MYTHVSVVVIFSHTNKLYIGKYTLPINILIVKFAYPFIYTSFRKWFIHANCIQTSKHDVYTIASLKTNMKETMFCRPFNQYRYLPTTYTKMRTHFQICLQFKCIFFHSIPVSSVLFSSVHPKIKLYHITWRILYSFAITDSACFTYWCCLPRTVSE